MNLVSDILVIIFCIIILNLAVSTILMKITPIAIVFLGLKIFILSFKQLFKFFFKTAIEKPIFNPVMILVLLENFLSNFAFFTFGSLFFFLIRLIFNTDVFDYDDVVNLSNHFILHFFKSEFYPVNSFIFLNFSSLLHYFNLDVSLNGFL